MKIQKAFKFELMPNGEQIRKMKQFSGCARFVFNHALAYQNEQYEKDNSFKFSYVTLAKKLPEWKEEFTWLKDAQAQMLQQSLKDLERAFINFFQKRAEFPKFKKKGSRDSFRFPQNIKLEEENSRIKLPKIGWVRYRNSRNIQGVVKNATVSQKCGKWYVSIQTEFELNNNPSGGMVVISSLFLHKTPAVVVQHVITHQKITAKHSQTSNVSNAVTKTTLMLLGQSTY